MKLAVVAAAFAITASAAVAAPRHAAQPPAGVGHEAIDGCWKGSTLFYGKYSMKFCLSGYGKGHFQAWTAGYDCKSGVAWHREQSVVRINVAGLKCPGEIDWTKDRIRCRIEGTAPYAKLACLYVPGSGAPAFSFVAAKVAH